MKAKGDLIQLRKVSVGLNLLGTLGCCLRCLEKVREHLQNGGSSSSSSSSSSSNSRLVIYDTKYKVKKTPLTNKSYMTMVDFYGFVM